MNLGSQAIRSWVPATLLLTFSSLSLAACADSGSDEGAAGEVRGMRPDGGRNRLAGRGAVGKQPVAGARDRASGRITARPVAGTSKQPLQEFVREHARAGAAVHTDELAAYAGMQEYAHEAVTHSLGEYVRGSVHTNGIESFWALFKRGYYGTFHHMSRQHLGRYLAEFAGRHNLRQADTAEQMRLLARGFAGRVLTWQMLAGRTRRAAA